MPAPACRLWALALALVAGAAAARADAPPPLTLHVAPAGHDAWSGRLAAPAPGGSDGPLATLEGARDALRGARRSGVLPAGGAVVLVHAGTYARDRAFDLGPEDGGAADAPVVYRAAGDGPVRVLGGRVLTAFAPVDDPVVRERLPEAARAGVLRCDLRAAGVKTIGRFSRRGFGCPTSPAHLELFFAGRRLTPARWPNEGEFARIAGVGDAEPAGDGHGGKLGRLPFGFLYDGDRPARWKNPADVWVHGYWAWDWASSFEQVESIDPARRLIVTKSPHGLYGFRPGQRFYALNVLEELDRPGEYWVDAEAGALCFWPPGPVTGAEMVASELADPIVRLRDVRHVRFEGLAFEAARGRGVEIHGGEGVSVQACTLRNLGNQAVVLEGGTGHRVADGAIADTGDGGISVSGGDRVTLTPGRHEVAGNVIERIGAWVRCYQPAVSVSGVGHRIAYNRIADGPHSAIILHGNEHVVEFNDISRMCLETGDAGAIYIGRDWTQRGNVIRHNAIRRMGGVGMGSMAVYLDDCTSGTTIYGNLFYKVTRAAFIGGGRDNTVENNVFVDCEPAVEIDGRGLDPSPVWHGMVFDTMKKRLDAMRVDQPPYRDRYPELARLAPFYGEGKGVPPEGNRVLRNIRSGGKWLSLHWHATAEMVEAKDNLAEGDPGFVDAAQEDFRLRDDSPAWSLGFQRIPFERIGPGGGKR